jgi:signal transduction histidine kinase
MVHHHDHGLVLLSVVVSIPGAYAARESGLRCNMLKFGCLAAVLSVVGVLVIDRFADICSPASVSTAAAAETAVDPPHTIRVVLDNAYAPYSFYSADGKLRGILIDQWRLWEKKTGIKVEIHAMDWGEALRRMLSGEFDVIDSIVETPDRSEYFDFTPPYTTIDASIFFRSEISGIADIASLKGFPVGVKVGDQHIDRLKENGVTTVIFFPNNDAIVDAAKQHKINVFVADAPSVLYLLNKAGVEPEFRHSAPIFRDELRRGVRKGNSVLLHTVSAGFAAIDPGELNGIKEKWFGSTINSYRHYLAYATYAAAAALLLIASLAGWNRSLRKGILLRTAALAESEHRFRQIAEKFQRAHLQLQSLSRRLLEVQETERRHIARELHDEIGQDLTAIKLSLEMSTREPPERVQGSLSQALGRTNDLIGRVRNLSLELRPAMLDDLGLLPTLRWHFERYTAQSGIKIDFRHEGLEGRRFERAIETAAYRIIQEALTNVARHTQVERVQVEVAAGENKLTLRIQDRGAGFDPDAMAAGVTGGVPGMRERTEMLGGELRIESRPGAGTLLIAELPLGDKMQRWNPHV